MILAAVTAWMLDVRRPWYLTCSLNLGRCSRAASDRASARVQLVRSVGGSRRAEDSRSASEIVGSSSRSLRLIYPTMEEERVRSRRCCLGPRWTTVLYGVLRSRGYD
ncbi:hypothetical protein L226DRAFT_206584 [Lentinus tigrinus ALCF2SS1-7]|uniref:uncharacterized protein n=1 Tax=Lentinus tigrinus ALCF2SS1-7 TaxID=1328758 RepID=UPI001165EDE1|nr:hypothetical protein L226DRAFT_206584 [Lentinus tigrinus ALCF2SS1-7]